MAFSTPLICCSSGVMTVSAMVLGEAPGYWPLTTTVGGTISGYSLMGRLGIASRPATVMRMASTVAKIGLSIKKEEMFIARALLGGGSRGRCGCSRVTHGDHLRVDRYAGMHALRAVDHHHSAGLQALANDAQ